uniref:butyrophilin-like protein 2 isoform X2 n=1 Tax=Scatophagus argus TaxID=75038 RepID=UPI001ED82B3E|nr:butyrophilin-like protein 2 isoform X2 [Scatophagus argus]
MLPTGIKCVVFAMVLDFARGDTEVSCVFMESCVLPCSFQPIHDVIIHWIKEPGNTHAHSYFYNQDQFSKQDQSFKGRTSLFTDQISRGNASLQLTGVKVQDQSRYKCYTSTISGNKDLFINLKVDAPVTEVHIQQVENRIICSSEGIYPEPELTWSTSPPSNMTCQNTTTVQQTEQQLYSISSTLIPPDSTTDLVYSCTVSTRRNTRRATLTKLHTEVSCVFMESCVLPCSFQPGHDVVIHWIKVPGNTFVHSYFHNQDQFSNQDQSFKGRTSLFTDQISRGNASLQLTGVKVQDQSRYKCYTSPNNGNKDLFISLKVDAPVTEVHIQQVENRIICSSEGIYPEPELTWSTSPPSNMTFKNTTTVQQTEQQLYSISSTLIPPDSTTDLVYSCTVSTRRNTRRATLTKLPSISGSSTDTTIPCSVSNTDLMGFSLVWRFNHSQIILNETSINVTHQVSEEWRQRVKGVSESGNLMLQDLSLKQEGIYTCELSNAEETFISNTFLRVEQGSQTNITGIIIAVLVVTVVLVVLLTLYYKYKKGRESVSHEANIHHNSPAVTPCGPKCVTFTVPCYCNLTLSQRLHEEVQVDINGNSFPCLLFYYCAFMTLSTDNVTQFKSWALSSFLCVYVDIFENTFCLSVLYLGENSGLCLLSIFLLIK